MGYARRNLLLPIPSIESFEALNAYLEKRCPERMDARLRGHAETIGQWMERDMDALPPLPTVPYDACDEQAGRVSSLSLVFTVLGQVPHQRLFGAGALRTPRRAGTGPCCRGGH